VQRSLVYRALRRLNGRARRGHTDLSGLPRTAKAPGQSLYSAATLAADSMSNTAASRPGSRKAVLKKFENVSESGFKRQ